MKILKYEICTDNSVYIHSQDGCMSISNINMSLTEVSASIKIIHDRKSQITTISCNSVHHACSNLLSML